MTFDLTNGGLSGDPAITLNPANSTLVGSSEFGLFFDSMDPIVLEPGESTTATVTFAPESLLGDANNDDKVTGADIISIQQHFGETEPGPPTGKLPGDANNDGLVTGLDLVFTQENFANTSNVSAQLSVPHSGDNTPVTLLVSGIGATALPIGFGKSTLAGATVSSPTSLQFGPDGRLYVAQQNGLIKIFDIVRDNPNDYTATLDQTITSIKSIPNHDDDGTLNASETDRLVTGILVTGTASNPVIYVSSSDPRIGAGPTGNDLNLDTNSGIISRLTWNGTIWDKLDLVLGLPRSEENHASNGMQLDPVSNTLYLAQGGHTNMGATSNNFALQPEYALSAAIISVDLDAIGESTYVLPTLDDEDRAETTDLNDPFGGNDGKNQAILVPGGPVQVYAPGFRNPYDLLITSTGRMYTIDNGPNAGWGGVPIGEGPDGNATNARNEPGQSFGDGLHFVTEAGYYGGHPNPTRSNPSNTFNASNPQSPVSTPNAIESDYRIPGVEDGALIVYPSSTNGIVEYTASNFGTKLQGQILAASFDNSIKRIELNENGDSVLTNVNLFNNVGSTPLDVTAVGDSGPFRGTVWVADIFGNAIIVFEPDDFDGGGGGPPGDPNDVDSDGYTNDDEIANGTDPLNAADVPADNDMDFVSDFLDTDDDNDTILDTADPFALDLANGQATSIGTVYTWETNAPNPGGILNLGLTGLMTNGTDDYLDLFDPSAVIAGGAAGLVTLETAQAGTARGTANSQQQGFQFGVNTVGASSPFMGQTRIEGPFTGLTPQSGQEMGFYMGVGDQDNYIAIVLVGNGGGAIEVISEIAGVDSVVASTSLSLPGPDSVDLFLSVDPIAGSIQPSYLITTGAGSGPRTDLGSPISIPSGWLSNPLAVGLISVSPLASQPLPVSWDFLGVVPDLPGGISTSEALVVIDQGGDFNRSSTFGANSFQITNNSASGQTIDSIQFDLGTAFMIDQVFDPFGTAGDPVGKTFTPDSGATLTGVSGDSFAGANGSGFDILNISFDHFDAGETFTFSVDIDPTSIQGAAQPGPQHSGSVSGLELTGAQVTVHFSDGAILTTEMYRIPGSVTGSQNTARQAMPDTPGLQLLGIPETPSVVTQASQTARITGPVGESVLLLTIEGALHLAGVPNGGFDIDAFEANKAIAVNEQSAVIGAGGFVDVPITLTRTHADGGINHVMAVIKDEDGTTSALSPVRIVELV